MSNANDPKNVPGDQGDPLVRSFDPFTRPHLQTPDEVTEDMNPQGASGAVGTVESAGHEVEAEPDSDMNLEGFDKK